MYWYYNNVCHKQVTSQKRICQESSKVRERVGSTSPEEITQKRAAAKGSTTMQQTIRTLFSKPSESGTSSSKQKQVKEVKETKGNPRKTNHCVVNH